MPSVTFELTGREKEDVDRACRRVRVATASIARDLLFRHFKIKPSKRRMSGPKARSTAEVIASRDGGV